MSNYTISILDDFGCSSDTTVYVSGNIGFTIDSITGNDVSCHGYVDGNAAVFVSGTGTYTYQWSNGNTTSTASGLYAGMFYVTVSDSLGCYAVDFVAINEPDTLSHNDSITNINCYGNNNGAIYLNITGGTPSYSYNWQGPNGFVSTNEYLTNLSEGGYYVTVTDANACRITTDITVIAPDKPISSGVTTNPPSCHGYTDGTAISSVSGGTSPYIYFWSNGDTGNSTSNLGSGEYILTITDANNCSLIDTINIADPAAISVVETITDASCIGNNDGSVSLNISGGSNPYTIVWDTDPQQTDTIAVDLFAGDYNLTITDFNNCPGIFSYTIADGTVACLEIPTVFTPNGDGTNDDWELKGIWIYDDILVEIYNRWGDLIFSHDGSGSEYDTNRWDGTWNGKELPISSYVFIIDLKDNKEPIQGIVTIKK